MPDTPQEARPLEKVNTETLELTQVGLMMEQQIKRLAECESERQMREFSLEFSEGDGQIALTTEVACAIFGMLSTAGALADWLTDNLYLFENKTFDENTTIALTTARRAQGEVANLREAAASLQDELRLLIVNNRCRRQEVEYLNHLTKTIELAKEYKEEQLSNEDN